MHRRLTLIAGLLFPVAVAFSSMAETTATLEKTHLCCTACVKDANTAVESAGAKAQIDQKGKKVTITAASSESAQKALDALVASGFYGTVSGGTIKNDAGAPAGNVKSLSVTTHNCCRQCTTTINSVIKSVPGAAGEVEAKAGTFTVTGDYNAAALVKAFNDAGFGVKVAAK